MIRQRRVWLYIGLGSMILLLAIWVRISAIPVPNELQARAEGANSLLTIFATISILIGAKERQSVRLWWIGTGLGLTAVTHILLMLLPQQYEWVWFIGQLLLISFFYLAKYTPTVNKIQLIMGVCLLLTLVLAGIYYRHLPYITHAHLPNPLALLPAIMWIWLIGSTVQNGRWQDTYFDHWLLAGMTLYGTSQLFLLTQTTQQQGAMLSASHLGYAFGHIALLIGLSCELYALFDRATQTEENLRQTNNQLKQEIKEREQLEQSIQLSLKRRTNEIETVTAVAQEIATAPALPELFQRVVTLVQDRFDYYHAQVYTLSDNTLRLQEGTGETAEKLKNNNHQIPLSATKSLVVQAVLRQRPILVPDVTQSTLWLSNPLLPETKAELAVCIQLRDEILGVLDVQSNKINGLNEEDQLLLMGLCGQIAVAIHSHRLREQQRTAEKELQHYAQELERSNRELEDFAHIASHDLQEPLRMVTSYLQLLDRRHGQELNNEAQEFIGYAINGAQRMRQLTEDLLTYSRVSTNAEQIQSVDCEQVLDITLNNLQIAIMEAEAAIIRDPLPIINGNTSQFIMLFQNLIGNAIKFRGETPPVIHIKVKEQENSWLFAIQDNGIGIANKHLDRIFIIFQRLHNRKKYAGTGIGLTICKKIIERHGGQIWVESEVGLGTTFWFTIPK